MNGNLQGSNDMRWLLWGGLYAAVLIAIAGYFNYTEPYSPGPAATLILSHLILWAALYLPLLVLPLAAGWKVTDFGFSLSPTLALVFVIVTMLCAEITFNARVSWGSAAIEAFARTGEEVFFRGFLFALFARLFNTRRRPWLWAAVASSLLFTLVHTQTFQPSFLSQYGSPLVPVVYTILERLFNVFGLAFVFALLRAWTRSILPAAVAHSLSSGGIQALPFVLVIYFLVILLAYRRREPVAYGLGAPAG